MSDCGVRLTGFLCAFVAIIFTALPIMFWLGRRALAREVRPLIDGRNGDLRHARSSVHNLRDRLLDREYLIMRAAREIPERRIREALMEDIKRDKSWLSHGDSQWLELFGEDADH